MSQLLFVYARQYQPQILVGLCAAVLLLFIVLACLALGMRRLRARYRALLQSSSGMDLEQLLHQYFDAASEARKQAEAAERRTDRLTQTTESCFQRAGLVHYDAFDTVGGRQSFSLALLDAKGSGFVLTTLYGRDSCRVYGKGVQAGNGDSLSEEEQQAISVAMGAQNSSHRPADAVS